MRTVHFNTKCQTCKEDMDKVLLEKIAKLEKQLAEKDLEIERLKQDYDEVWEDTFFSVKEDFELNNNCNECRRYYAEEFNKQLKNAIVPKFKVGDKVYAIIDTFAYTDVFPVEIRDNHLLYEVWDGQDTTKQHFTRIFATKEEAEAKLKEMKSEN